MADEKDLARAQRLFERGRAAAERTPSAKTKAAPLHRALYSYFQKLLRGLAESGEAAHRRALS
jgi:hypothetical protein